MVDISIYTVGGTVQAGNGIYIPRQADEELFELCCAAKFAYVLTARQMGKSSLMIRTAERLEAEGTHSVIIDLTSLGTQVTVEAWYLGLLTIMGGQLDLETDIVEWWNAKSHLGVTQRLIMFFKEILLAEIKGSVVVFVDEIDTTLSLDFTDDFFAAIRHLYTSRAREPDLHRLSFILIGVATPSDLIRDPQRTPFNIGQQVDLTDFTFEEALPLSDGLGLQKETAESAIQQILEWTSGHPYLTQRICQELSHRLSSARKNSGHDYLNTLNIAAVVHDLFLGIKSQQDNNLRFIRDMLTRRATSLVDVLTTYREIVQAKNPVYDDEQSLIKSHLKLSGVVHRQNNQLQVRNLIYEKVFNEKWIKENFPILLPPLRPSFAVGIVTAISIGTIRALGLLQGAKLVSFDAMMKVRPSEPMDEHIIIVGINNYDLDQMGIETEPGSGTGNQHNLREKRISNQTISDLLEKLYQHNPSAVGLNVFVGPDQYERLHYSRLVETLETRKNFFLINKILPPNTVFPPKEISQRVMEQQVAFSDIPMDSDNLIRRAFLGAYLPDNTPTEVNDNPFVLAFPMRLANMYLNAKGYGLENYPRDPKTISFRSSESGKYTALFRLRPNFSRYTGYSDIADSQILLNPRVSKSPFHVVSLHEVMTDQINPRILEGKIVLIGFLDDDSFKLPVSTISSKLTMSSEKPGLMSGVEFQAHATSQIVNAVLEGRNLVRISYEFEYLWISGWSLIGGIAGWYFQKSWQFLQTIFLSLPALYTCCHLALIFLGLWLPLVPPILSFIVASTVVFSLPKARKVLKDRKT